MSATRVPSYGPRGNMGLSKHGDPVFLPFCPLNQNLACVRTWRGGDALLGSSRSVNADCENCERPRGWQCKRRA